MTGESRSGEENLAQGDFGEQWLQVVAAAYGILHGPPATQDLEKADVQLTLRGVVNGTYNPTVKVQVKASTRVRTVGNGDMLYHLDAGTHNVLCRDDHSVRRILVVLHVSADGDRVRLQDDGTLLVGRAAWVSLEGSEATSNQSTCAVTLPIQNTIDEAGLHRMIATYGVRRTTIVGEYNPWEGGSE